MEIETRKVKRDVVETTKVEHALVSANLVVYKITNNRVAVEEDGHKSRSRNVRQGFAEADLFEKWVPGRPNTYNEGIGYNLMLVKDGFLENSRLYGTPGYLFEKEWSYKICTNMTLDKPFDELKNGASVDNIVMSSFGEDGMLRDLNGDVLPVAVVSDYLQNMFVDNSRYDLEKVVDILWNNPAVVIINDRHVVEIIKDKKNAVQCIESYNSTPDKNLHIRFLWRPTTDEYRELWEKQLSYKTKYPSTEIGRAMFDLDILGLRKGGAALFDDFWKSTEYG